MSRSRNIKPGFFKNEELAELHPLGRILFAGLWCLADREGRLEDRPKRIKTDVLPYDNCDVDKLLQELHDRGFILRYQARGKCYIAITNWHKHQTPHIKEAESELPAPEIPVQAPEKSESEPDRYQYDPPESLISESLLLNPESFTPPTPPQGEVAGQAQPEPESGKIPYVAIIDRLNEKAGTNYRYSSDATKRRIQARWNEGYRLTDFCAVIDKKAKEWLGTEQEKFLRPETLFGPKFEGYLNQRNTGPPGGPSDGGKYLRPVPRAYQSLEEWAAGKEDEHDSG